MKKHPEKNISVKKEFRALGTDIFLEIFADDFGQKKKAQADLEKAKEKICEKEKIFSRFNPKSELCRLNKHIGAWQSASADMLYLAGQALRYNRISDGLYDPRVIEILETIGYDKDFRQNDFSRGDVARKIERFGKVLSEELAFRKDKIFFARRMDFSGIAKGYIVDQVAKFLKSQGWKNFLVDAGGDMSVAGLNCEKEKWKIAVEGIPEEKLMLELSDCGIATSGISRKKWTIAGKKFHHLINPKKPNHFSFELRTVSVVAESAENADGRAKTLVLMGKEKGLKFAEKEKVAAIFLDYRGNVTISSEAKRFVAI